MSPTMHHQATIRSPFRSRPRSPCRSRWAGRARRRLRTGCRANQPTVAKRLGHSRPPVTNHRHRATRPLRLPGPDRTLRCPPRNALSSFPGMRCAMRWRPTRPHRHHRRGDKPPVVPNAGTDLEARGLVLANDRVHSRQGGPPRARNDRSPHPTRNRSAAPAHRHGIGDPRPVAEPAELNCAVSRFRLLN